MTALIASLCITAVGAGSAAIWHIFGKNGAAETADYAIGPDLLVAAIIMQLGFFLGAKKTLQLREEGAVLVAGVLVGITAWMRSHGYWPESYYYERGASDPSYTVWPMKPSAMRITSSIGTVVLCAIWWLNVNIGLVVGLGKWLKL